MILNNIKIKCLHGYFIFEELESGHLSKFASLFGLAISMSGNHYTFDFLVDAPKYSILGKPYLGVPATATYEGEPWEVMKENNLIFDFTKGLVVPLLSVIRLAQVSQSNNYYVSPGLILPGSIKEDGSRVRNYSAWYSFQAMKFKYAEVSSV